MDINFQLEEKIRIIIENKISLSALKDIEKYEKVKGSSATTGRSLWCLGVHPTVEEDYLKRLIDDNKFREIHPDYVFSKNIEGTSFSFTLI